MTIATRPGRARAIGGTLIALGALLRLLYVAAHPVELVAGEAFRATDAFARTGTLADPFLGVTGPTAHLLPVPILIGGAVYRLLGIGSRPAEWLLSCWSIGLVLAAFAMTAAAFRRAGGPAVACLLGLALCCGAPLNIGLESITFRLWEGALASALAAALLVALVTINASAMPPSRRETAWVAVGAACLFLVSPQLGIAGYGGVALLFLRRAPPGRWPISIAIGVAAFAAVLAPWILRNERVFGAPLLRSNFGLELAIGFHPGAVDPPDPRRAYIDRLRQVQPLSSPSAFRALEAAGGEVAYAKRLGAQTRAWMRTHPADAARIGARHVGEYLFPPLWMFRGFTPAGDHGLLGKAIATWTLAALGLLGLARRLLRAPASGFTLAAPMVLVTASLFFLVQPILRYRYLIYVPLNFYAADMAVWLLSRFPRGATLLRDAERVLAGREAQPVAEPAVAQ